MKHYILLTFCLLTFAASLHGRVYERGVSQSLARERASQLRDIEYDLTFDIPANRKEPVKGHASISFVWDGKGDVVLDFQGPRQHVTSNIFVDTKKGPLKHNYTRTLACAAVVNEHIIIQKELLNKGVHNTVHLDFISGDDPLNRNDDYLYTLFVPDHARAVFPCFDQPDLKATFKLTLRMPVGWRAMSNGIEIDNKVKGDRRVVEFNTTDLLPTYLFSFTAGKFSSQKQKCNGREVEVLYRETDPQKIGQLKTVFNQVALSLKWMEDYTGITYPFQKYGFVVLPGYQFGGMEHPGAIQFNDKRIFLGAYPTPDEELARLELIAHETAHMWFGDLVTMRWFDDVWTKEVFASFMASKIARKQFKDINHDLNFLKMYQARALATDRTLGAHPIKQPLDNLNQASLLYDNIIYDKAPVVMRKLEEQTGPEHFQVGLRKYLRRYAYRNASWNDLIQLLDKENPDASLKEFSRAWVEDKGMPLIRVEADDHGLTITQEDPEKQNLLCPQHFDLLPGFEMTRNRLVTVNMNAKSVRVPLQMKPDFIIPNYSGSGYGRFLLDEHYNYLLTKRLLSTSNDLTRYAIAQTLYENYLNGQYDHCYFSEVFRTLRKETNPLVATSLCTQLHQFVIDRERGQRLRLEPFLLDVARETTVPACRQTLLRLLATDAITPEVTDYLYTLWQRQDDPLLQERDYIQLSYYLAIMRPAHWKEIIDTQRCRLQNADLIREYEFVSRACNPSVEEQRKLFRSLLNKKNREVEPWAQAMLRLLSCRAREPQNNEYITPGLEVLEEIQQTGDVFFPANWLQALLSQHKSREARQLVVQFLDRHPNYPSTLRNKILEAAYDMMRIEE